MQEFKVIKETPELVIELSGEIDSGNADELYENFINHYNTPSNVVFECGKVDRFDDARHVRQNFEACEKRRFYAENCGIDPAA